MILGINMVGGGWVQMQIGAETLGEVSDWLRHERSLIGRLVATDGENAIGGEVLIPAQRIAMISEA